MLLSRSCDGKADKPSEDKAQSAELQNLRMAALFLETINTIFKQFNITILLNPNVKTVSCRSNSYSSLI